MTDQNVEVTWLSPAHSRKPQNNTKFDAGAHHLANKVLATASTASEAVRPFLVASRLLRFPVDAHLCQERAPKRSRFARARMAMQCGGKLFHKKRAFKGRSKFKWKRRHSMRTIPTLQNLERPYRSNLHLKLERPFNLEWP